ncbi:GNAT family N-acetyltransferase [Metabacillus litoralis]|uniref:GNAT family N-acetyltransferase n=1 Tax=Metabacillus litoralis TaxID=152268 RepID=UPI001CFE29CE|nr:GNAT family protein [Metabacillus litoralis]
MSIEFEELTGIFVKIVPMETSHLKTLFEISRDKSIWSHLPKSIDTYQDMEDFVEEALHRKEDGSQLPLVVINRETSKVIGSTRFLDISHSNKNLEIGWTWLTPSVWGTEVNLECKYLLLTHCFETLKFIRVQFKTDEHNIRSQKAIERIGGVKEGVLRNHMLRKNGTYRNSVYYSIIDTEWKQRKRNLEYLLYH